MEKFFICSANFCDERMLDYQRIYNYLIINGWQPVKKIAEADLVIIGAVSRLRNEEDISIDLIKYYSKKKSKSAKLILTGFAPKFITNKLTKICEFSTVYPTDLDKLDDIIKPKVKFCDITDPNVFFASQVSYRPILKRMLFIRSRLAKFLSQFELSKSFLKRCINFISNLVQYTILVKSYINPFVVTYGNNYFYLRVSKGCLGSCSYCAIKFASGALKSKPLEEIINEFKKGLDSGYKVFYLASEDVGSYGIDISITIAYLFKNIFHIGEKYDYKLIIPNFNAQWFVKYYTELEPVFLKNQHKILFLQIPIESGSNRILKLMNRPYDIEELKRCLSSLREKAPSLNIATDIIVGFPGETEEDFKMTKELLQEIKFSFVEVFTYEDRPNTLAVKINDKIPQKIIDQRKFELFRMQNKRAKVGACLKKASDLVKELT